MMLSFSDVKMLNGWMQALPKDGGLSCTDEAFAARC
jgi:hypothetical protein